MHSSHVVDKTAHKAAQCKDIPSTIAEAYGYYIRIKELHQQAEHWVNNNETYHYDYYKW